MGTNIESLILAYSKIIADQMVEVVKNAKSEEDVRHECNKLIDNFIDKAGLKIRGRHEYGLAGGRIDSKYGGVIIEYKDPNGSSKIIEDKNAPGVRAVVSQIKKRFLDFQSEENVSPEKIFAVGCDGNMFVFVRNRGKIIDVEAPQAVTLFTVERLLRAIVSLGAQGQSFTPDNLCDDFGGSSQIAQEGIEKIYDVILSTKSSKAAVFFKQWQILFGEVCGYDVHGQSPKIKKLGEHYCIPDAQPAELLFAVHTYYGILIKLLATETVSSFSPLGISALKKLVSAPTSPKLRAELESIEQGGIWTQLGIRNFLEGDLFSWYLDAWENRLDDAIRGIVTTLDKYDPTTLSVEPAESRDLLKKLYQHLFPKSVRHDLGEYYTPDWLSELTLNEVGYDGNPDKRLLDPACGSGTFLVMTINRIKAWFNEHRHDCGFSEDVLLKKILSNVIGFDLNPLAVMAARTNYLLAIRDLLRYSGEIEIPIYLCDSILTPSEYGDLFTNGLGNVKKLKTSAGEFLIPLEITNKSEVIGKYADALEFCIRTKYNTEDFIKYCETEGIRVNEKQLHEQLFQKLELLDEKNENGIWARIIKNAFAPLFIGSVDYIVGNPPWVNWESLPDNYRDAMKQLWQDYGLFTLSGSAGRLGGGKKDLSMLFVYTALDNYLKQDGHLSFVITQSVFKTQGAGDGFRRFKYKRNSTNWYLKPLVVHDLSAMQVFEGATNRTAVFACKKTILPFKYPVKYEVWSGRSRIDQDESLANVFNATCRTKMDALPVIKKETSPWLTVPPNALSAIQKVIGKSDYQAYAGSCTWLNAVYWIHVIKELPNGNLVIENLHNVGKIKVQHIEAVIEPDLVYPLLRGRDVNRWVSQPSCHIILTQDPKLRKGIPEATMKINGSKTYAYLKKFEGKKKNPEQGTLRGRSGFKKYFKPTDPFYSMYNVGTYTMAKWKVVWSEVSQNISAAVVGSEDVESKKTILPDHTIIAVPCSSNHEAHFICALLNSSPVQLVVRGYIVLHPSPHVLGNISIPKFDTKQPIHRRLAELSNNCHVKVISTGENIITDLEAEIDKVAAKIWGITDSELRSIQDALVEM